MSIFNRIKEVVRTIRFAASPRLYGRYSAGAGEGQEIGIGDGLEIDFGSLRVNPSPLAAETAARVAGDEIGGTAPVNGNFAFLTTTQPLPNSNLTWTSDVIGTVGNDYSVEYIGYESPVPANQPLTVTYDEIEKMVTVKFQTNSVGEYIFPTATQVRAAYNAASFLAPDPFPLSVEIAANNNGTGTVFGMVRTYLAGGDSVPTPTPPYIHTADGFLYIQESGIWKKVALTSL